MIIYWLSSLFICFMTSDHFVWLRNNIKLKEILNNISSKSNEAVWL